MRDWSGGAVAGSRFSVQVEGLNQLKKTLRQLKDKDLSKKVREVNKEAAELVKPDAQRGVPQHQRSPKDNKKYRPGKLAKSVKVVASANSAAIKAGTASRALCGRRSLRLSPPGHQAEQVSLPGHGAQ